MADSHEAQWDPEQPYIESTASFLAAQMARDWDLNQDDERECEQELMLHLFDRLRVFDATRASRRTFIARGARHRALNLIEYRSAQMRNPQQIAFSLDDPLDPEDDGSDTYGDVVDANGVVEGRPGAGPEFERKILLKIELEAALTDLPPELRELCQLLSQDIPMQEIARRQGVHRDTVHQRMVKVRKILRARGWGPRN